MDTVTEEEVEDVYSNPEETIWIDESDISQLCRVCANPNEYLIPIFHGEGIENDLQSKISKHLPIKVSENDKLPVQLCYQCASTLIAWHDMVVGCLEAHEKLKSLLPEDEKESGDVVRSVEIGDNDHNLTQCKDSPNISFDVVEKVQTIINSGVTNNETQLMSLSPIYETEKVVGEEIIPFEPEIVEVSTEQSEDVFIKGEEMEEVIPVTFDDSINTIQVYETYDENVETSVVVHELIEGFEDGQYIAYVNDDYVGSSVEIIEEEIKEGVESEDDTKPYICEDCGNVFKSLPAYRIHLRQHQKGSQKCNYCNAVYKRIDHLQQHVEIMHPNFAVPKQKKFNPYAKTFLCNTCGKILKSSIAYENHTLKHQSNTPFSCSLCSEMFPNKGARRRHEVKEHQLLTKANGNPDGYHVCEICGLEMFSDGAYYHHKDKHGDPYPCTFCGKLYGSRSLMQVHARRHTNERPHICTICRRSFKVKQELCAHMNTHKDIRPYQCPHCPKMCRKSSDLTHHIRTHTGEKPFICDQCGRGFAQAGDMRKHRQLHNRPSKINKMSVSS